MDSKRDALQAAIAIVAMDSQAGTKKPVTLAKDILEVAKLIESYFRGVEV